MRGRALRRHHDRRAKSRARRMLVEWWGHEEHLYGTTSERRSFERSVGRMARTPVPCSDPWCCGNPRGRGERTVQERRELDVEEARLVEAA